MNWFKKKKTTASTDGDETDEKVSTPENKKGKLSLTSKIFIGLIAGAIFGIVLNYCVPGGYVKDTIIVGGVLYIIGQGFIRLMQMLVVPLVFCSLVCGAMSIGDTKKLGTVGVRTLIFYLCTTALAIVVALFMANLINPGIGLDMASALTPAVVSIKLHPRPPNPFKKQACRIPCSTSSPPIFLTASPKGTCFKSFCLP